MNRRPILACTDLMASGVEALRQAHAWAEAEGRPLWVMLEMVQPDLISPMFPHRARPLVEGDELRAAETMLRKHVIEVTGRRPDQFELAIMIDGDTEQPSPAEVATDIEAEAIVVGVSEKSSLERGLMGTHAETLLEDAPCPVLVARATANGGPVVAMMRPGDDPREVVGAAHSLATNLHRSLGALITYEDDIPWVARDLDPRPAAGDGRGTETELAAAKARVSTELTRLGNPSEPRAVPGDPVAAVRNLGESDGAAYVVIGPRTGPEETAVLVSGLLTEANCSLLVTR